MSTDSKSFVQGVFRTLYAEHPEHWGNGLSFHNFSPANGESVYLVRTKEASTPIGFVGWQNRVECGKTIGYYSVGLLPEYRGQGYAKAAVAKLIAEKSAGVDEVHALIHQSNTSSLRLAAALGVPVTKSAMFENVERAAKNVDATTGRVNSLLDRMDRTSNQAQDVGQTLGLAGAGGGLGYLAADFAMPDTAHGDASHMRNKRLKMLAGLLGAGAGVGVDQMLRHKILPMKQANLLSNAAKVVGPKILQMLKNKGVQTGLGAAAGLGGAALENKMLLKDSDPSTRGINDVIGATTGAMLPHNPAGALGGLAFKELGLAGLNAYQKDAPMRQRIADTQLSAAQAAKDTAGTQQNTAKLILEKARNLSNTDKALYGVAGAGLLGAGIYGANSLLNRGKSPKPPTGSKGEGVAKKGPSKIRFDVPTDSMPPEFFQGLLKAEQQGKPKYACFATRDELLQEIAADLEFVKSAGINDIVLSGLGKLRGIVDSGITSARDAFKPIDLGDSPRSSDFKKNLWADTHSGPRWSALHNSRLDLKDALRTGKINTASTFNNSIASMHLPPTTFPRNESKLTEILADLKPQSGVLK